MKKIIFLAILFLASCSNSQKSTNDDTRALIDLVESTHIIRALISQNKLHELLQEHDQEQLSALLDNVSPAHMAFESEVLETTVPLVVIYYFKDSEQEQEFIKQLDLMAQEYDDRVKFVIIDVEKLFTLAQDAEIDQLPTILISRQRDIVERITDGITIDAIQDAIKRLM